MSNDLINHHFEELIKTLITLASPADKQVLIMGYGYVGEDMLIDFESHYKDYIEHYLGQGLITKDHAHYLKQFDEFLDRKLVDKADDFLDPQKLKNNSVWENIRIESRRLLKTLDKDKLDITVLREMNENIEWTKTILIHKEEDL